MDDTRNVDDDSFFQAFDTVTTAVGASVLLFGVTDAIAPVTIKSARPYEVATGTRRRATAGPRVGRHTQQRCGYRTCYQQALPS